MRCKYTSGQVERSWATDDRIAALRMAVENGGGSDLEIDEDGALVEVSFVLDAENTGAAFRKGESMMAAVSGGLWGAASRVSGGT